MAEEVAALSVRLEATAARFERDMQRATRALDRAAGRMDRRANFLNSRLNSVGAGFAREIAVRAGVATGAIAAVTGAVVSLIRNGDNLKRLEGRFTALTGSADRAGRKIQDIFRIGAQTGASIEGVASALTRFTIASESIGATDDEVARLTESVIKLGVVGGASAQELEAGMLQFGQALASGTLQGEELRSILENFPLLARVIADAFGVTVGELRKLGADGELAADKIFRAVINAGKEIDDQFAQIPLTVDRAATQLANSWAEFTGELDRSLGVSQALANVLSGLAGLIRQVTGAINGGDASERLLGKISELQAIEQRIAQGGGRRRGQTTNALNQRRDAIIAEIEALNAEINKLPEQPAATFAAPAVTVSRGGRGGGGGGGKPPTSTAAQSVAAQIEDRIRALQEEIALVGLSEQAAVRLSAQFDREAAVRDLLLAAQEDGATITEDEIRLAEENARRVEALTVQLYEQEEAYRLVKEAQEQVQADVDDLFDSATSAITGLIDGTLTWREALLGVLSTILEISRQNLLDLNRGGSGGLLGSIISGVVGGVAGGFGGGGGFSFLSNPAIFSGVGNFGFANGAAFSGGKVTPFANGGIVNKPTFFPMADGAGLMGEAGPEAIMPLTRGKDGKLGVKASGGQSIVVNISTPDANSFRRSEGQIRAQMARAVARADGRNN